MLLEKRIRAGRACGVADVERRGGMSCDMQTSVQLTAFPRH